MHGYAPDALPPGGAPGTDGQAADSAADSATPEALLVTRAAEGDDAAFGVLVRGHAPQLLALATRLLGSAVEAEDAVQDALVTAWRRLPEFRREAAFGTWLFRITTNRCLNLLRARPATRPLEAAPEPRMADPALDPPRAAESAASGRALNEALDALTADQRACWVLRELHGMSYEEIADVVGIAEPAVRGRLFRARRSLMEAMQAWR
ncbi:RNA polymerase sigma factor [Yinghuangia soli]|uniref:RNA polymerase sigma factor n=1 Tax=Yinghuangia soli TaxID=2908204 RepID=A0AA41TXV4_9ACTN|nr:RNA polymerase sigma factor [Yinghuangia soli]MCF2527218.1 RNA polymerase sigma factor [Yinghuangia soli]